MNVLLCSVHYRDRHDTINGRSTWESLGIRYLAACLFGLDGVHVELHDHHFYCRSNRSALELFRTLPPQDLVGISLLHHNMEAGLELARRFREASRDSIIVVGGFGPTFWKEAVLRAEPAVDAVFLGDAEISLPEFVRHLQAGSDWRATPGILYRDGGGFRENPMARLPMLDTLPHPWRDERYPLGECTISASRGCAYHCTFCSIVPFYRMQPGKQIRFRSPESLVEEMESLQREHAIQWINFTDDDFLGINRIQPGWSDRIANLMLDRGLQLKLFFQTRADHVSEPVMRKLKEAGLRTVAFGIESCAPRMLATLDKRVSRERNREAIRIMSGLRINYELYSIFVDADSTVPELIENMDEFESMGYYDSNDPVPFSMQVNEFKAFPYPGTRLFQDYQDRGLLDIDGFRIAYRLTDPLLACLFGLCRDWNERWADLSDVILQYRYVPAIKLGKVESAIYYKRLHNQYFTLDTRWLREVCRSLLRAGRPDGEELARITASVSGEMEALVGELDRHDTPRQYRYDLYGGFAEP